MRSKHIRLFLPLVVLGIGGVLSVWLWFGTQTALNGNYQRLLNGGARIHAALLAGDVEALETSLSRMSRRWLVLNGTPSEIWRDEAQALTENYPAITAVQRLDSNLRVRWQVTGATEDFKADIPADLSEKERQKILGVSNDAALVIGDIKTDEGGARYVTLYSPLRLPSQPDGYVAARIDLLRLFESILKKTNTSNHLDIYRDGSLMFSLGGEAAKTREDVSGTAIATVNELAFDLKFLPTQQYLRSNGAGIPNFLAGVATIITLLATVLAHFGAQAALRARDLRNALVQMTDQERRYREMLRRSNMGVAVTDSDGRVLEANEPYLRILGCTAPEQVIGHSVSEFLPEGGMEKRAAHIAEAMRASGAVQRNIALRQRGGRHVLISANTILDRTLTGEIRLVTLAEDITENNRIQNEIVESKRIYEEVFESSDVAITDIDMSAMFVYLQDLRRHGVRDLRQYLDGGAKRLEDICRLVKLNNINQAGLRLFGGQSVKQLQDMDYFLEGDRPAQMREMALAIWDGVPSIRKEVNYTSFTGKHIAIIYSLRLPGALEEARRVPVVTMDVTDMRSAESARQANIAKTQFLASMSHEIRTPLNGVIGNLELLAQTTLETDQESLLFDAEKAAKSLLALIGNILDFSKIEAGKLTVERIDLVPSLIVQEAVDIVQSRARQKGIFVTGFMGQDLPQVVKGDPTRIRQILLNLLGNAVKFTSQGGVHVNLTAESINEQSCKLVFYVHDSGRGFSQDIADDLFLPFMQDHNQSFEDYGGTGLGLSICKSLVDTFGGEIGCESVPDQGASFWFTVPVEIVKPSAPPPALPDLALHQIMFVMPGGDEPPQELLDYLKTRNGAFTIARSGSEALAISRQGASSGKNVDIAVYISKSEQWPGVGFASALRDNKTVPMAYAADAAPQTWRKALRSGAAYVLAAGVAASSLDRNIHHIFGRAEGSADRALVGDTLAAVDISTLADRHVLVLEDRLVNQTIIQRQLKKLHMTCTIAGNGIAGLERLATGQYDMILCDCSMPEMNGYEFTRIVREREREKGNGAHLPIIAMTANAFREDMEKCFAAGMDDFISKPVTLHRLASVLSQWAPKVPKAEEGQMSSEHKYDTLSAAVSLRRHAHAVDLPVLQRLLGSTDHAILADIVKEFMPSAQESWMEVQRAMADEDADALGAAAHGAKGEARNMGATVLGDLYETVEQAAKRGDLAAVEKMLGAIPTELQRVQDFVDDFITKAAE